MLRAFLLLIAGLSLTDGASMAGTNAKALRRPKVHRHYHEAAGTVTSRPRHVPTLEEALMAARQYKKQVKVRPVKIHVNVPKSADDLFISQFDACIGASASSLHGPTWDECDLELASLGYEQADEAGGWMQ